MVVAGDLLELHDVGVFDPAVRGTWVFAAPPGYIVSQSGEIFVIGIVADQDVFLLGSLVSRIRMRGFTRLIVPEVDEDLSTKLDDQGLQRLSEKSWLRTPKAEPFGQLLSRFELRLAERPPAGTVNEMEILDGEQPVTYYRGRWKACTGKTGIFVGRRPQEYGAPIWCLANVDAGNVARFLDLPASKSRWRGCDEAWHLQMAIDARRGQPQQYRSNLATVNAVLISSRRCQLGPRGALSHLAGPYPGRRCLMSYMLPVGAVEFEENFLQEWLWLSRTEDSE